MLFLRDHELAERFSFVIMSWRGRASRNGSRSPAFRSAWKVLRSFHAARNLLTTVQTASGWSACSTCPQSSMTSTWLPAIKRPNSAA